MLLNFKHRTVKLTIKLTVIVCVMFGFGYALVPIYKAICEATGINVLALQDEFGKNNNNINNKDTLTNVPINTQIDNTRTIEIDFDSNEAGQSRAIWVFKPAQRHLTVHPGQLTTIQYELKNLQPRAVVGQAIPSYLPARAAQYFNKIECFCFKQQTLQAGETKTFPVVFSINPALGQDIKNITLSYTFFEVKGAL